MSRLYSASSVLNFTRLLTLCALLLGLFSISGIAPPAASAQPANQPPSGQNPTGQATGQTPMTPMSPTAPMANELSQEELTSKIEGIRAAANLSDEEKTQLINVYTQAQQALKQLVTARDDSARFSEMVAGAEEERKRLDEALAATTDPSINVPTNATRTELEQLKADADTTRSRLEKQEEFWNNELTRRQTRATEIPQEIANARKELEKIQTQLNEPPATNEKPEATAARKTYLAAQQLYLTQKLAALESEQQAYPATSSLVPKQQELARKELRNHEKYLTALEEQIRTQIARETQEKIDEAEAREEQTLAELRPLAEEVRKVIEDYQAQTRTVNNLDATLTKIQNKIKSETEEFDRRKARIETLGLTNAMGRLLREKKATLLRDRLETSQARRNESNVREVQEKIFGIAETRNDLLDNEAERRESLINEVLQSYPDIDPQEVQDEVDELFRARLDNLAQLQTAYQTTFEKMVNVDSARLEYIQLIDSHLDYINERVLWIRSDSVLSTKELSNLASDLQRFSSVERWSTLWKQLSSELAYNLTFLMLLIVVVGLMAFYRPRAKAALIHQGSLAAKRNCREFLPTFKATILSLILSLLWPALIAIVGWRLRIGNDSELFAYSLGTATLFTALFLWPFEWLRQLVRPGGLAEMHFGTSPAVRSLLKWHSRVMSTFGSGFVWIVAVNVALENGSFDPNTWSGAFGRIGLLVLLVQCTLQVGHLLRPRGGLAALMGTNQPKHILYRLRLLVFLGAILVFPVMLVLLAIGFYYTSVVLTAHLYYTFLLLVVVVSTAMLIRRWLMVRRRRLAMKQYRERMEKQRERGDGAQLTGEVLPFDLPDEAAVDLAALNEQTIRLFYGFIALFTGLSIWGIWSGILPALNQIGRFQLWSVAVSGEVVDVTLGHVLLATFVFAVTFFASKNVPALLEMFLLAQLPFDSGARFAITTITRYLIVLVGVIAGLSMIKVQWSQYSWLVAGASVGLGFGLQEIFANFVSGLIVLLERPCRVGDVVTVGDVTGVVSRIQIRATTVTNWDRQELIVPNKEFVTGRLLNWTLSSQINRVTLPVGIAYGSDTQLATRLLREVVERNQNILDDPAPLVTFESFGASSLDFIIRCYLPSLDNRLATIHELHTEIDRVFRENKIEIAFPQQDLHIRSLSNDVARELAEGFRRTTPSNGQHDNKKLENVDRESA